GAFWTGPRLLRIVAPLTATAALAASLLLVPGARTAYPESGSREAVERLNILLSDQDGLVVYPWSNYAVAYYGRWPARLLEVQDSTNGLYAEPERARSLVLRETFHGVPFQAERTAVAGQLESFLGHRIPTLVYLAVRGPLPPHTWIVETILSSGYSLSHQELHHGAILMVFKLGKSGGDGTRSGADGP
ncbi:MAG: hypothetical protein L0170_12520, partial [Acidobacteria bacterium]|nr:hypothetical protein [Acidobacteriota bacterium]